jgi:iron complex outermembrane receptor protein
MAKMKRFVGMGGVQSASALAVLLAVIAPAVSAQTVDAAASASPTGTTTVASASTGSTAPAGVGAAALSTVIVTGTRTTSLEAAESPAPVQILSAQALQAAAGNPDLIDTLAQIVPSLTAQAFGGDMANQTLQAKLRGLSPNHVLVLIDGKRRHTTGNLAVLGGPYQGGAGADLNFIPIAAIDHIEVLTEGAAAQYGTDAIAGVINIILKKKSSGATVSGTYGGYMDQGGQTGEATANAGFKPADGGYLNVTGEVHNHGHSQRGGIDPRVVDPANIDSSQGATYPNTNMPYAPGYPYLNQIQGDAAYHSQLAALNGGLSLSDNVRFYAFGTYGNKNANSYENYRLPSKVQYTNPNTNQTTYMYPYGFNPQEAIKETDYAFTAGLKGMLGQWNWDLSSTFGDDKIELHTLGSANAGIYAATGASPTDFYDGFFNASQWTQNLDFSRDFDVGMAGPLNVAFGAEARRDTYQIGAGNPASYIDGGAQSFPGFTPTDAGDHSRNNYAGYVDFAGKPIDKLYIDLAGRYEHYSDFGSTTIGKLTGRYDFTEKYAVRGTISTGFRAPTLAEEYYSTTNVGPKTAFVQLPPNAPAAAILGLGNGLQPEKSVNYSIGFVFRPLPNLTATLDLYQTNIRNRIVGSGTIYSTINGTEVSPVVTQAIVANGNQLDPGVTTTGVNIFTNGVSTRTRGADFSLDYPVDYEFGGVNYGRVDWSVGATYNQTSVTSVRASPSQLGGQALFDQTALSDLTTAAPKYVVNLGALWTKGKYSVNLVEKVYGPSEEQDSDFGDNNNGDVEYFKTKVGLTPITNLDLGYQATKELKFNVGAINLFNQYPDQVNGTLLQHYRENDDNSAVQIYPSFSPFGINGGFYYVKATYSF